MTVILIVILAKQWIGQYRLRVGTTVESNRAWAWPRNQMAEIRGTSSPNATMCEFTKIPHFCIIARQNILKIMKIIITIIYQNFTYNVRARESSLSKAKQNDIPRIRKGEKPPAGDLYSHGTACTHFSFPRDTQCSRGVSKMDQGCWVLSGSCRRRDAPCRCRPAPARAPGHSPANVLSCMCQWVLRKALTMCCALYVRGSKWWCGRGGEEEAGFVSGSAHCSSASVCLPATHRTAWVAPRAGLCPSVMRIWHWFWAH